MSVLLQRRKRDILNHSSSEKTNIETKTIEVYKVNENKRQNIAKETNLGKY